MVKKLITVSLIVLTASLNVYAQRSIAPLSAGPFIAFKGGTNLGSTSELISSNFAFNGLPDFGASLYVPLSSSSKLGLMVDLGYITLAYGEEIDGTDLTGALGDLFGVDLPGNIFSDGDLSFTHRLHYIGISPQLTINSLLFGFQLGIPVGGTTKNDADIEEDIETDGLSTIFEIVGGAKIPLVKKKSGRLNLLLKASYALSGLLKEPDDLGDAEFYNPKVLSISVGVNYLFSLSSGRSSAAGG